MRSKQLSSACRTVGLVLGPKMQVNFTWPTKTRKWKLIILVAIIHTVLITGFPGSWSTATLNVPTWRTPCLLASIPTFSNDNSSLVGQHAPIHLVSGGHRTLTFNKTSVELGTHKGKHNGSNDLHYDGGSCRNSAAYTTRDRNAARFRSANKEEQMHQNQ